MPDQKLGESTAKFHHTLVDQLDCMSGVLVLQASKRKGGSYESPTGL